MRWRVLISAPYMLPVREPYVKLFEDNQIELVRTDIRERLSESELLPLVANVDGVICGDDQFTERVLQGAPKLKVISKWGTGIDSIDQEAAARHNVAVYRTLNAFTDAVADTVMGYILAFARQLPWMDRDIREGRWEKRSLVSLREVSLGVVGVGNIGKAVARRAVAFGMDLLGTDIVQIEPSFLADTGMRAVSLEELLKTADFVSLNCCLNPTSYQLIGKRELTLMKPTSYLINTARGMVVDEGALVETLMSNGIAGAALDVFEQEPLPADSPLRTLDTCLLAPHNANNSPESWRMVTENTVRNLLHGLRGVSSE